MGWCLGASSPGEVSGQLVPLIPSWYAFQEMPALANRVTRWRVVRWWLVLGSASSAIPKLVPASNLREGPAGQDYRPAGGTLRRAALNHPYLIKGNREVAKVGAHRALVPIQRNFAFRPKI